MRCVYAWPLGPGSQPSTVLLLLTARLTSSHQLVVAHNGSMEGELVIGIHHVECADLLFGLQLLRLPYRCWTSQLISTQSLPDRGEKHFHKHCCRRSHRSRTHVVRNNALAR